MSLRSRSSAAETLLPAGMRSTRATRALLALLRSQADQRFAAAEAEAALAVNRVTVFRALDRLAKAGLLERGVDADRVTRYRWVGEAASLPAPRRAAAAVRWEFECLQCHQVRALKDVERAVAPQLRELLAQAGASTLDSVRLHGLCSDCAAPPTLQPDAGT